MMGSRSGAEATGTADSGSDLSSGHGSALGQGSHLLSLSLLSSTMGTTEILSAVES